MLATIDELDFASNLHLLHRLFELRPRNELKDLILPLCQCHQHQLMDLSSFICFSSFGLNASEAGGCRQEKLKFRQDKFYFLIYQASKAAYPINSNVSSIRSDASYLPIKNYDYRTMKLVHFTVTRSPNIFQICGSLSPLTILRVSVKTKRVRYYLDFYLSALMQSSSSSVSNTSQFFAFQWTLASINPTAALLFFSNFLMADAQISILIISFLDPVEQWKQYSVASPAPRQVKLIDQLMIKTPKAPKNSSKQLFF
ncbi:MAG: hypothetical protein EZS28_021169 [Streblomastix strix]|uniref:Uncharacterized protein n=1 Tax=Streblomastix strix TaxID=222440 RepID=A0A5J4VM13_9EUKA|nr:MAG: hypothetical protein EZS28_021169 [Streblomastix strix]